MNISKTLYRYSKSKLSHNLLNELKKIRNDTKLKIPREADLSNYKKEQNQTVTEYNTFSLKDIDWLKSISNKPTTNKEYIYRFNNVKHRQVLDHVIDNRHKYHIRPHYIGDFDELFDTKSSEEVYPYIYSLNPIQNQVQKTGSFYKCKLSQENGLTDQSNNLSTKDINESLTSNTLTENTTSKMSYNYLNIDMKYNKPAINQLTGRSMKKYLYPKPSLAVYQDIVSHNSGSLNIPDFKVTPVVQNLSVKEVSIGEKSSSSKSTFELHITNNEIILLGQIKELSKFSYFWNIELKHSISTEMLISIFSNATNEKINRIYFRSNLHLVAERSHMIVIEFKNSVNLLKIFENVKTADKNYTNILSSDLNVFTHIIVKDIIPINNSDRLDSILNTELLREGYMYPTLHHKDIAGLSSIETKFRLMKLLKEDLYSLELRLRALAEHGIFNIDATKKLNVTSINNNLHNNIQSLNILDNSCSEDLITKFPKRINGSSEDFLDLPSKSISKSVVTTQSHSDSNVTINLRNYKKPIVKEESKRLEKKEFLKDSLNIIYEDEIIEVLSPGKVTYFIITTKNETMDNNKTVAFWKTAKLQKSEMLNESLNDAVISRGLKSTVISGDDLIIKNSRYDVETVNNNIRKQYKVSLRKCLWGQYFFNSKYITTSQVHFGRTSKLTLYDVVVNAGKEGNLFENKKSDLHKDEKSNTIYIPLLCKINDVQLSIYKFSDLNYTESFLEPNFSKDRDINNDNNEKFYDVGISFTIKYPCVTDPLNVIRELFTCEIEKIIIK